MSETLLRHMIIQRIITQDAIFTGPYGTVSTKIRVRQQNMKAFTFKIIN